MGGAGRRRRTAALSHKGYPTNNAQRLSFQCSDSVNKHRLSLQIQRQICVKNVYAMCTYYSSWASILLTTVGGWVIGNAVAFDDYGRRNRLLPSPQPMQAVSVGMQHVDGVKCRPQSGGGGPLFFFSFWYSLSLSLSLSFSLSVWLLGRFCVLTAQPSKLATPTYS